MVRVTSVKESHSVNPGYPKVAMSSHAFAYSRLVVRKSCMIRLANISAKAVMFLSKKSSSVVKHCVQNHFQSDFLSKIFLCSNVNQAEQTLAGDILE